MDHSRVRRISALFHALTGLAIIGLPLAVGIALALEPPNRFDLLASFEGFVVANPLPNSVIWGVTLLGFLPLLPVVFVLISMRRLFGFYRCGETLSLRCALAIKRIGLGVLLTFVVGVLTHSLQVLALTMPNAPGERSLSIAFNSNDFALLLTGGLLLLIGWVMGEAVAVAEENRGFV
ncbi:MAG: DUF2975 domain-containing protein [Pseudomonadota bacterium]